jgi:histidyl-tRNA synthetase
MADIDATSLAAEIERQKVLFNDLRINPATPVTALEQAKKQLGDLQRALGVLKKKEGANEKKDGAEQEAKDPAKKKERLLLKTAKV